MAFTFAGMYGPHGLEFSDGAHAKRTGVTVLEGTSGTTEADLYTDRTKDTPTANPTATDSNGNLYFFADPGFYRIKYGKVELLVQVPVDPEDIDAIVGPGEDPVSIPWSSVSSKPSVFPPDAHSHALADVTGLDAALDAKSGLAQIARTPEQIISGAITYDAWGIIATAAVIWPDGTPGTYTTLVANTTHLTVDSYEIEYDSPATATFTQPTITRNANGQPITIPAIVES